MKEYTRTIERVAKCPISGILFLIISVALSIWVYKIYGTSIIALRFILLIINLLIISYIDIRTMFVYDISTISGIILQGILIICNEIMNNGACVGRLPSGDYILCGEPMLSYAVSGILGYIISRIICKVTRALGEGDIGVYILCTLSLGLRGILSVFMFSFFFAGIFSCAYIGYMLIMRPDGRGVRGRRIPFAPFISMAAIGVIITSYRLDELYMRLLSLLVN